MSGQHARLSASSAHRWLACPGSVGGKGGGASQYPADGTFAHFVASQCLEHGCKPGDWLLKKDIVDGFEVICTEEMVDVVQLYLDEIAGDLEEGDYEWAEMPLLAALSKVDPDLGGTADFVRYRPSDKSLRVTDFKYGSGTYVEADSNEQLMLYALGAMLQVGEPINTVEVVIVQPRFEGAKPVRSFTFSAFEIMEFVARVKDAATLTRSPNPPLKAGDHCKFCPKARTCAELERHQHTLMAAEFDVVSGYDPVKLAAALDAIPLVKERIKALEAFAYAEAQAGHEIPGYKLVDKRPARKWKSEGDVIEWAQNNAIDPFAPRELLSVAQLEKKLGETAPRGKKKEAGAVLVPFIEKVSSGTVLVPLSDDRQPAKRITAADFEALT
jgi:hypothetical protein